MNNKNNSFMIDYKICCLFVILFFSCESGNIEKEINIHRFEKEFFNSNEENLDLLIEIE